MSKAARFLLFCAGALLVLFVGALVAFAALPLLRGVAFGATLDWRLSAAILLAALLPAAFGVALLGYFLFRMVARSFESAPDAERDYLGRYLSQASSRAPADSPDGERGESR